MRHRYIANDPFTGAQKRIPINNTKVSHHWQHKMQTALNQTYFQVWPWKCSMRSTFFWFAEFCHSQCLSHLAASFIVAWAETSIAKSCKVMLISFQRTKVVKKVSSDRHYDISHDASLRKSYDSHSSFRVDMCKRCIDPSAGSPTETLLRLLLPLSNKVY